MRMPQIRGSCTALVTPFTESGHLDENGLRVNVAHQIESGTSCLVPCGTTGESPALTEEEHHQVVRMVVDESARRVPVIVGTGTNNTQRTIAATLRAKELGADAALVITPYYNKPTQEGLYQHFRVVAEEVDFPLVIYNVPGRTGVNIESRTVARLAELPQIVGIKEASGKLDQVSEIIRLCGEQLSVLSGDDALTLPILAVGGVGVISVVSNFVPTDMATLVRAFFKGDLEGAQQWHKRLLPLCQAMFLETNPGPVKTAMGLLGMPAGQVRLPLVPLGTDATDQLVQVMREYGLLNDE
jgi:4-hydroxy-tetrahydrodipicolinate synthase